MAAVVAFTGCTSASEDEPDAAKAAEPTPEVATLAPTTTTAPAPSETPATPEVTATGPEPTIESSIVEDVRLTFTVPDRWMNWQGWSVIKPDLNGPVFGVTLFRVGNIFSDPCQWVELAPPPGPSVDDLVAAFASVPALNASAATDVTVDGFLGKQIELTIPDFDEDECRKGRFALADDQNPDLAGPGPNYVAYPNAHHRLWILDVEGTRLVIGGITYPDTSPQDRDDIDTILNSIQIEPAFKTEPSSGENQLSRAVPHTEFGGTLTFTAPPLRLRGDGRIEIPLTDSGGRVIIGEDPVPVSPVRDDCLNVAIGTALPIANDATVLARKIEDDPDFETTESRPVSIASIEGLQMDVTFSEQDLCYTLWSPSRRGSGTGPQEEVATGEWRMRLYLVDYPESAWPSDSLWRPQVLTVAVIAPKTDFESVLEQAAPIVESIEFGPLPVTEGSG